MTPNPSAAGLSADRLQRLDRLFRGYVERDEYAGLIATVHRRGHIGYYQKFGWMDREEQRPMRDDTIFMIMSMTKPITAVGLMTLYEEGAFNLNTPVWKFLPEFKSARVFAGETPNGVVLEDLKHDITFRHLLTHTAGLSYGFLPDDPVDRLYTADPCLRAFDTLDVTSREVCESLAALPLCFQPGTRWRYSFAIDVLGRVIEVISGATLDKFLEDRIFRPLGMVDTAFFVPADKSSRVATVYGHTQTDSGLVRLDQFRPSTTAPRLLAGGSGLMSTIEDYSRFAQMLVNGGILDDVRVLSPRTVALFSRNHMAASAMPYGYSKNDLQYAGYGFSLGTRVLVDVSQSGVDGSVGEFGWEGMLSTYFWVDPVEALHGVLMTHHNPNAYHPIHQQFKQLTYQALET